MFSKRSIHIKLKTQNYEQCGSDQKRGDKLRWSKSVRSCHLLKNNCCLFPFSNLILVQGKWEDFLESQRPSGESKQPIFGVISNFTELIVKKYKLPMAFYKAF